MFKLTPNPPVTDPASPYESPDSKKFHEAAERALDHYLKPADQIMAAPYKPNALYMANPRPTPNPCWPMPVKPSVRPR